MPYEVCHHVRRDVVGDDDHEDSGVAHGHLHTRRHPLENARSGKAMFIAERDPISERDPAVVDRLIQRDQDRHLDQRCRRHHVVFVKADALSRLDAGQRVRPLARVRLAYRKELFVERGDLTHGTSLSNSRPRTSSPSFQPLLARLPGEVAQRDQHAEAAPERDHAQRSPLESGARLQRVERSAQRL